MDELFAATTPHPHRTPVSSPPPPPTPPDLLSALDHATQSLKRVSSTPQLISSLRAAHEAIASFLSRIDPVADVPMLEGAMEQAETGGPEVSRAEVDEMEEEMRECSISSAHGKRRKRNFPSSWPAGRVCDEESAVEDTVWSRRRDAIDLIFQFHGCSFRLRASGA